MDFASATKRCLIWLGQPSTRDRQIMAAVGWNVRAIEADQTAQIGMRGNETVVVCIDTRSLDADVLSQAEQLALTHPDLPVLAIVDPRTRTDQDVQRLLRTCTADVSLPLQTNTLQRALEECSAHASSRSHGPQANAIDMLLGQSQAMLEVRARLHQYGPIALPVMICGETGTGKELAARALHELSSRAEGPFVAVNCGAMPTNLIQSELFGHERGAFTGATTRRIGHFESAHGGTIFLDEIGDLPLDAQVNLLRVLQEGSLQRVGGSQPVVVDVRVIAATHIDLHRAVDAGNFRNDLLFRLDVLRLQMPPLHKRGDDIELMAHHFLSDFRDDHPATIARGFSPAARRSMAAHAWPGNVRELLNRVRRAAVVATASMISEEDLGLDTGAQVASGLDSARVHAEHETLIETLRETGYNVSACARKLKVSRVTIYRLCRKHGLSLEQLRN
ncbi:DNA-binding transcriptional response regulator, NtrC family, contains REC, AAA-type ATPase, and a Fis-type DNA-binding domains [Solilutibacter tolerans]|uniref:DNA-binding transcriptional response regulator, NtrC family, contains REC, AAA-type ATPase, and a Fis-type DNA-binding domains n=2 Tax=Solilutibacter tolerans TaxID=1604334 RepID=A0A1N6RD38_9GAMM|nr:sigma-54 dependent transcriptional regulator [Lysobacter tolerans]SIQ26757.1 DNA-binding transcriptional response regulator, NtrC family, contains REC, AAA-type ATPase, and a Fis-type DNA-binding domains [Lysobacter tolerans]